MKLISIAVQGIRAYDMTAIRCMRTCRKNKMRRGGAGKNRKPNLYADSSQNSIIFLVSNWIRVHLIISGFESPIFN